MQSRRDPQPTFFDMAMQQRGAANKGLETITREVDFSQAEQQVAGTYGSGGRPACRVGVLLRIMILQHLYGLSDPQVEEQIKDRLSFQKFIQLDTHETVPDETTICRFRQRLIEGKLHEQLLELLNRQLEARGYIVKRTTLVDATSVESSRNRPEVAAAANGTAPDADASYTRNNGILKQGSLHVKLSRREIGNNRKKGLGRRNIERIFGHLKQWQGYRRVRYLGLARNQLELTLKAVAYNLKRLARIIELQRT
jgi:IS5 family transposase